MRNSRFLLGAFGAIAFSALVATVTLPAAAAGTVEESIAVRYNDLDLDDAAGIAQLYKRLRTAAEKVCDTGYRPQLLFLAHGWRACVTAALEQGVAAVDRPALTAYHAAKANPAGARSAAALAARN
ncbi:MAG TPA: UrcA family protein [Gammaproteobacteria bacterium]|nr:UrcA family protein [Gammaproteobacteria bacterium]